MKGCPVTLSMASFHCSGDGVFVVFVVGVPVAFAAAAAVAAALLLLLLKNEVEDGDETGRNASFVALAGDNDDFGVLPLLTLLLLPLLSLSDCIDTVLRVLLRRPRPPSPAAVSSAAQCGCFEESVAVVVPGDPHRSFSMSSAVTVALRAGPVGVAICAVVALVVVTESKSNVFGLIKSLLLLLLLLDFRDWRDGLATKLLDRERFRDTPNEFTRICLTSA